MRGTGRGTGISIRTESEGRIKHIKGCTLPAIQVAGTVCVLPPTGGARGPLWQPSARPVWGGAKVVIGDGTEWIWDIADEHFSGAIQVVDLFHARQHLWDVARLIHPGDDIRQRRRVLRHQPKLDNGKIVKLVGFLRSLDASFTGTG